MRCDLVLGTWELGLMRGRGVAASEGFGVRGGRRGVGARRVLPVRGLPRSQEGHGSAVRGGTSTSTPSFRGPALPVIPRLGNGTERLVREQFEELRARSTRPPLPRGISAVIGNGLRA
jgi:hypothetical protein